MDTPSILPTKVCTKCKRELLKTTDYFYKKGNGLTAQCKSCVNLHTKERRLANPEKAKQQRKERYARTAEKSREYSRQYRKTHFEECRERDRRWRLQNQEKLKKYFRNYPRDHEKERLRSLDKDRRFPEQKRYRSAKRRAIMLNAQGSHTTQELKDLYEQQDGRCGYCGISIYWDIKGDVWIDHIEPISRGGSNSIENLLCTCAFCNMSKHDKTFEEWQAVRGW